MKNRFIIIASILTMFSSPAFATLYKCTNEEGKVEYRDKHCSTGEQSELQQPSSSGTNITGMDSGNMSNLQEGGKKYLDNLKTYTPYSFSYELPLFGEGKSKIMGRQGDKCHVISSSKYGETVCNYSDETIVVLTSEKNIGK